MASIPAASLRRSSARLPSIALTAEASASEASFGALRGSVTCLPSTTTGPAEGAGPTGGRRTGPGGGDQGKARARGPGPVSGTAPGGKRGINWNRGADH